jgi:SOS-response transcriptional repressor LexA
VDYGQPRGAEAINVDLLMFVARFHASHGWGPSHREITAAMGWESTSTSFAALARLRRAGMVTWEPGIPRSLRPLVREVPGPWLAA